MITKKTESHFDGCFRAFFHIKHVYKATDNIYIIQLSAQENLNFALKAGQYLELLIEGGTYPFSIANFKGAPNSIELHIKKTPSSQSAEKVVNYLLSQKKVEARLPLGHCTLDDRCNTPIIFLAGGTGFAPIKAMIEFIIEKKMNNDLFLYWGARKTTDFYLRSLVQSWEKNLPNLKSFFVVSEQTNRNNNHDEKQKNMPPLAEIRGERIGLVHEKVLEDFADLALFTVIANGPSAMVYEALAQFKKQGLPELHMRSDVFSFS